MFGARIRPVTRQSMKASRRRNIDNTTPLLGLALTFLLDVLFQHNLDLLLHTPKQAVDIDLEQIFHAFGGEIGEFAKVGRDAGVVDCGVETAVETENLGVQVSNLGLDANVCCDERDGWCVWVTVFDCFDDLVGGGLD